MEIGKSEGTTFGLFTSGIINKEGTLQCVSESKAELLKSIGITDCYVSLYGINEDIHNRITDNDSFQLTCRSIENMKKAGICIRAHVVLNSLNINHINEFFGFAEERGIVSIRILHLVKAGMAVHTWDTIGVSLTKQIDVIKRMLIMAENHPTVSVSVSGFPEIMPCRPDI